MKNTSDPILPIAINDKGLIPFPKVFVGKYEVHTISFQTLFVQASKIVVDSCKFSMLLLMR